MEWWRVSCGNPPPVFILPSCPAKELLPLKSLIQLKTYAGSDINCPISSVPRGTSKWKSWFHVVKLYVLKGEAAVSLSRIYDLSPHSAQDIEEKQGIHIANT